MNMQYLVAFGLYFVILLIIAYISHRKQTTSEEFIVGSRSLNFWVTALSAHASDMSNWLFMGYPAAIFLGGIPQAWIAISLIMGMYINWQFVAKKLRVETERYQSYTLSTYFEKRLNDTSGIIRLLTALITIFYLTWYLSAGLIGMGWLFESVFQIDYTIGLTVSVVATVMYVFYGGFVTVAWTDLFQGLFLLFFIVVVPIVTFSYIPNGAATIIEAAKDQNISLSLIPEFSWEYLLSTTFLMAWGLGYWGQPHILTKFMGIKNANEMNKAKWVGMTWLTISLTAATFAGLVGVAFFYGGTLDNPELVFIETVKALFPPMMAGFVLCAVLAATVSTMDSQILVCASVLSEDCYKRFFRPKASEKEKVLASRLGVVLIAAVALYLSIKQNTTILKTVEYAWTGLGASFGPLLLMCLYSKKLTRVAAIAGIIVGSVVSAGWHLVNPYFTDMAIPSMLPAFFLSLFTLLALSRKG